MNHALQRPAALHTPQVRRVEPTRPLRWLRSGYADLEQSGGLSLAYGVFAAVFGAMLLSLVWSAAYLVPAFIGGFLRVAPFPTIGLYAMSAQLERGIGIDATRALFA